MFDKEEKVRWHLGVLPNGRHIVGSGPIGDDGVVDYEALRRDATSQIQDAVRGYRVSLWARAGLLAAAVAVAGFLFGQSRTWDLAEVRAARTWLGGACAGANRTLSAMGGAILEGDYPDGYPVVWWDVSYRLRVLIWEGVRHREDIEGQLIDHSSPPWGLELEGLPEQVQAELAERAASYVDFRDDPALADLEGNMALDASACSYAVLDPQEVRDGSHYDPSGPPGPQYPEP